MKLGITSYAYRWAVGGDFRFGEDFKLETPLSVFDLINKVSELRLDVLQICENISFDMAAEDYKRVGKVAEAKGIALELGAAGIDLSILNKYVQIADLTGSHLLRLYPQEREPIERLIEKIRSFLPVLRDRELTFGIENSSLCLYTSHQLAEIFEQVDDPLVGACIDVVNSTGLLEKPLDTIKVLSPYAVSVHLKDYCVERKTIGGYTIFGMPLGKGMLDVKAVLDIIEKSGRNPNILLEQWMERTDSEEETLEEEERWLKESVRFVRSIL